MCGIAGYIGLQYISREILNNCINRLHQRGPDDRGIYENTEGILNVGLLHTRLSIIDLDPQSAQPFHFDRYVFSYNGEIYNYIELRNELKSLGYKFHTNGDTEVMAAAWSEWGKEALNRFDGMWSIAIYDKDSKILTLTTDPFGEKPLYYMKGEDGTLWFGSQIDTVLALSGKRPKVNWQHLKRYLVNGYKSLHKTENTFVEDITNVPGNRVIEISTKGIFTAPYWRPPTYKPDFNKKRVDFVAQVRETLIESVSRRMRSDVPLAFCMSGGVDSNSIIGIAASHLGLDVHGFTILHDDVRYDERELVDLSSRELGLKNHKIMMKPENFVFNLQNMVAARFGPVSTLSYYTQNYLYKAISEYGYKVAISGTAADELFTGYYDHHLLYLASEFSDPMKRAQAVKNWEMFVKPITRNPLLQDPDMYLKAPGFRDHLYYKNKYYAEFLRDDWCEPFIETLYCGSLMRNRMMNELFHEAVPIILTEDDMNAMQYSVENRSPFLSRDLLNISMQIPDEALIQNGFAKTILREAMEGLVPEPILWERRKIGFNSSLFEVADIKSDNLREIILDKTSFYDMVDRKSVEAFLSKDLILNSDSKFLFNLINAKMTVDIMES